MSIESYRREMAEVQVSGESTNRWIRVTRESSGEFTVWIRPGELRRHTADQVAGEIESALSATYADFNRVYLGIRRRHFGAGLGLLLSNGSAG